MQTASLLGIDIGSSSVKVSLLNAETGRPVASAVFPETEMAIIARKAGWAEQNPETWWAHMKHAVRYIGSKAPELLANLKGIGISYQMHGLVTLDREGNLVRDAIIWCDSRAVPYGEEAFRKLGSETCLSRVLNSPGNFTAAKLAWVKDKEPESYKKIAKIMLPGDYIAYRLTGEINTTPSGLSEGILYDAGEDKPAGFILDHFGFPASMLPRLVPSFSIQGRVHRKAAEDLGVPEGVPVAYRAGDQPNNAFSLNVLNPGEAATTAGTSGVVYGITDKPLYDDASRVNTFVHVNHEPERKRFGVLLCLNGTGILNRWLKEMLGNDGKPYDYPYMNRLAETVPAGAEGLMVFPYGNGAERTLSNADPGAGILRLNFNIHGQAHLFRAGQEGIVFALAYGLEIMEKMGMGIKRVKAGYANMFLSPLFRRVFAAVTGASIELYNTDGAQGAARGAGIGIGFYKDTAQAFEGLERKEAVEPDRELAEEYKKPYADWKKALSRLVPA